MPRSHPLFNRPATPTGAVALQDRDRQILELIHNYRFLDSLTLRQLLNHQGKERTIQERLQKLFCYAYLDRPPQQIGLYLNGDQPFMIYGLGREGAKVLSLEGEPKRWVQKNQEAGPIYLQHTVGLGRFRACLTLALAERPDSRLLFWKQGDEIKTKVKLPGRREGQHESFTLRPDGLVAIQQPTGKPAYFFPEYQRSFDRVRFLKAKGMAYRAAWKQGTYVQRFGITGFRPLIIAQTQRKMETLRYCIGDWLAQLGDPASQMWLFTSEERYTITRPASILEPIWQPTGDNYLTSLLD